MHEEDTVLYLAFLDEARRHLSSRTRVLVGVEMDIDPADPSAGGWRLRSMATM